MWKAEKIELEKNNKGTYFEVGYSLKINDEWISNKITLKKEFKSLNGFKNSVNNYIKYEDCDACFIIACYHFDRILFIPVFNDKNTSEEYFCTGVNGEASCPPHKWFTDEILELEDKELDTLLSLISGVEKGAVKLLFESELATVFVWEKRVSDETKFLYTKVNLVTY